jgi:hypothetical protein
MVEYEMGGLGFQELVVLLFGGVIGIGFYALLFFVLWKFHQTFSKINENIAGIRRLLDRSAER